MRIYITGASCAGVTTLGHALVPLLGLRQVDVDDFYWLPIDPPFSVKRPPEERVRMIEQALGEDDWVLSGSCNGWGEALIAKADLIVFVETPTSVRLERLAAREKARFGERIAPGGDMHEIHVAFRAWAAEYDNPAFGGRNRARHEVWIAEQTVPLTRIDGTCSPEEMSANVVNELRQNAPGCRPEEAAHGVHAGRRVPTMPWQPITATELLALIETQLCACEPTDIARFEQIRTPLRSTPVRRFDAIEHVFVMAEYQGTVLYYEDVEEGFNLSALDAQGFIATPGFNQWELGVALCALFTTRAAHLPGAP